MRTMHPRLEEIRKRLLTPPVPSAQPRNITPKRPGEIFSPGRFEQPQVVVESEDTVSLDESLSARSSTPSDLNPEEAHVVERIPANMDESVVREAPQSLDGLAQAVAALFEPARQCQGRLAEITEASESISHLTRVARELCEPLKSFHNHIRKLSSSFESMRTFRDELSVLAESFAPVRALHAQVIQLAETVRTNLAEVANGLEPAKGLQVDIANLALAMDSVTELQAQFYALSKAFGDATDPKVVSTEATEDSPA
jgi:methylphosphotriester-DNA--protein-cysteine methyltransferase